MQAIHRILSALALFTASSMLFVAPASGQETSPPRKAESKQPAAETKPSEIKPPSSAKPVRSIQDFLNADSGPAVSVRFAGGTLAQYADAIRKGTPGSVNIALAKGAESLAMPAVTMENVNAMYAVKAIEQLVEMPRPNMRVKVDVYPGSGEGESGLSAMYTVRTEESGGPVFRQQPGPSEELVTRVLSLNNLITPQWAKEKDEEKASIPAETVLTAIQTAVTVGLEREGEGRPLAPEVQFHKESGMLILRCTPGEAEAAERVIRNLEEDLGSRMRRKTPARTTELFTPVHVSPKTLIDAMRLAYPDNAGGQMDYRIEKDALKVFGTEHQVEAARVLMRVLDRENDAGKVVAALRDEMQNMQAQMMAMQRDVAGRDEALRGSREQLEMLRKQLLDAQEQVRRNTPPPK